MAAIKKTARKLRAGDSNKALSTNYRQLVCRLKSSSDKQSLLLPSNTALNKLTLAALALPGLMVAPAHAEDNETNFQYGYYKEGPRNLFGAQSAFAPIEVNSINGSSKIKLSDRIKFAFNYVQDTWGGATPIATAPLAFGGNGGYTGGKPVVSGATPYLFNNNVYFDKSLNPLTEVSPGKYRKNGQLVHTLSSASPETRKQGDFKLGYEWDEAELTVGGGVSIENDYESSFGSVSGRWDFNQKLTSLNAGLSYTSSDTQALVDHDAQPYIYDTTIGTDSYNAASNNSEIVISEGGQRTLYGEREDWGTSLGLTQVVNKNALLEAGVSYTRSTGYLANPYKTVEVAFIDPDQTGNVLTGTATALLEQRPDERNQWTGNLGYIQHIEGLDAALHFDYRIFQDDWGITAHTFEADWVQPLGNGWTVTPRVRYYSQDEADFYNPYLISKQGINQNAVDSEGREIYVSADNPDNGEEYYRNENFQLVDEQGNILDFFEELTVNPVNKTIPFDRKALPKHFSSDHRLSGYGALSGGITVSKQFVRGVSVEVGGEYYTHAGDLKLGGGGEGDYADFDYYMVNAALKVDLSALNFSGGGTHSEHSSHEHEDHHQHGGHAPAGVMFSHMLPKSGDLMFGYRYMYSNQSGDMLKSSNKVSDKNLINKGCGPNPCYVAPDEMSMHMHMLDIMYAPTDWLNLMLMPQFVDMNMSFRGLDGAPEPASDSIDAAVDHSEHPHNTGGVGDTGIYAMFKLLDKQGHRLHATLGFSAPTGDVDIKLRRTHQEDLGFIHYGMQLGSGTWDFKPSLTYTGQMERWSWGAQLSGTKRMEDKNESGFAFGDIFQSTAWGSYSVFDWLSTSVRGVYTDQSNNKYVYNDTYNKIGPMDYSTNYGGQYWDVGFGVNAFVGKGDLKGNSLSFEWLQPVSDNVNGYQLEREGSLSATWSLAF